MATHSVRPSVRPLGECGRELRGIGVETHAQQGAGAAPSLLLVEWNSDRGILYEASSAAAPTRRLELLSSFQCQLHSFECCPDAECKAKCGLALHF